jgi:hypothetical protein
VPGVVSWKSLRQARNWNAFSLVSRNGVEALLPVDSDREECAAMKMFLYIVALLLSLPNLIAGLAVFLFGKTLSSPDLFQMLDVLFSGLFRDTPVTAGVIFVLLVAGCITETRPYAAIGAFALNVAALAIVISGTGVPTDLSHGIVFLPILLALIGFAWIAYQGLTRGRVPTGP